MGISAIVLTHNSEESLEACLESVKWCNEIIVVDDDSTDATRTIAKKYTDKIYEHLLNNDFSQQRNYALGKATGEWALFVDSDEIVSETLKEEIELRIKSYLDVSGYYIKREDTMWGKKLDYGETGNMWLLRLARKDAGKWQGKVHETWKIHGKTQRLKNTLSHFPHPTVSEFLSEINFYSTLRAEELHKKNVRVSFYDIIFYPKAKFFLNYLFKQGYRDGIPGFLLALFMSFHSFLVRGKLWQLQHTHQ